MQVDEGALIGGFERAYDAVIVEGSDTPVLRAIAAATGLDREKSVTIKVVLRDGAAWSRSFSAAFSEELSDCLFTTPNPCVLGVRVHGAVFLVDVTAPNEAVEFEALPVSCSASDVERGRMFFASDTKVYAGARVLIERELLLQPESHWLLSRLALTYYEQFDYARALEIEEKARALAPDCPLVLWGCAGSLEMLDRPQEAIIVYDEIISRGIQALATDPCGEGYARACGLLVDSLYRSAKGWRTLGDRERARALIEQSLARRGPGCESIYSDTEVQKFSTQLG